MAHTIHTITGRILRVASARWVVLGWRTFTGVTQVETVALPSGHRAWEDWPTMRTSIEAGDITVESLYP